MDMIIRLMIGIVVGGALKFANYRFIGCASGALTQRGYDAPIVDLSKCTGCGKCVGVCPTGALMLAKSEQIFQQAQQPEHCRKPHAQKKVKFYGYPPNKFPAM
jgi:formate hydrogenlyase subunit 6/NADH:ubiquinone oxidoreductase subunit I